jgi:small subunit ribosomal protein S21
MPPVSNVRRAQRRKGATVAWAALDNLPRFPYIAGLREGAQGRPFFVPTTCPTPVECGDLDETKEICVQVLVRDNNIDQALKALKKKMQREGIFREMKLRGHYEKPSEKRAREKAEAVRRARKLARKKLQREGLLPMKQKPAPGAR